LAPEAGSRCDRSKTDDCENRRADAKKSDNSGVGLSAKSVLGRKRFDWVAGSGEDDCDGDSEGGEEDGDGSGVAGTGEGDGEMDLGNRDEVGDCDRGFVGGDEALDVG
jgi:hypothetical protein